MKQTIVKTLIALSIALSIFIVVNESIDVEKNTGVSEEIGETPNNRVVVPVILLYDSPNGTPNGEHVVPGQEVRVLFCSDGWCQIESGWVWQGCLSENPNNLKCEVR